MDPINSASNLDNFEVSGTEITSPRSLEACLRQGIDPGELLPLNLEQFTARVKEQDQSPKRRLSKADRFAEDEIVKLKYDHWENKRKEKLRTPVPPPLPRGREHCAAVAIYIRGVGGCAAVCPS